MLTPSARRQCGVATLLIPPFEHQYTIARLHDFSTFTTTRLLFHFVARLRRRATALTPALRFHRSARQDHSFFLPHFGVPPWPTARDEGLNTRAGTFHDYQIWPPLVLISRSYLFPFSVPFHLAVSTFRRPHCHGALLSRRWSSPHSCS